MRAVPTKSTVRLPRICVIGFKSLSRLVHSVATEFEGQAEIEVIDALFERSLPAALERERAGDTDVFITAGANASILRSTLATPVAAIKVGGFDVWLALLKARRISERIGIVTYGDPIPEVEMGKELLRVELSQRSYRTIDEARHCFTSLVADGYRVIVGSSVIVDMAEQHGSVHGILTYTAEAVRQAFHDALELERVRRIEADRFQPVDAVLQHLHEAVIAVDRDGRVTAVNAAMESLIGVAHDDTIGRLLNDIAPGLDLDTVMERGEPELGRVIWLAGANMVGNRVPVREHGVVTGALLTLQDAGLVQRADGNLRGQKRPRQLTARYKFSHLLGANKLFVRAKSTAHRYAGAASTVLISGESGTGKELFAQAIHNASARRGNPFVAVNCAAFPEPLLESELFGYEDGAFTGSRKGGKAGLFEAAHTGTVFLDEIGDMPLVLQTRLLRVLQEKEIVRLGGLQPIPVDVRIIAATHQPLFELVAESKFRGDLYYRLNILQLRLPSLRQRADDVPLLALQLLAAALKRIGSALPAEQALTPLMPLLCAYHWPGNVRELENIAERLAVHLGAYAALDDRVFDDIGVDFPELFSVARGAVEATVSVTTPAPETTQVTSRATSPSPSPAERSIHGAASAVNAADLAPPASAAPSNAAVWPSSQAASAGSPLAVRNRRRVVHTDDDVRRAVHACAGNRVDAAKLLGMSRTTLWRRLGDMDAAVRR